MGKTILVTGSQGTLGKKLVAELEGRGHTVFGCDLHHGERNEIRADVSEMRQVENVFGQVQPEIVYHLAAEFGRMNGDHYPEQLWKHNALATRNIIDTCVKGRTHLVFASSSEAYGDTADDNTFLHEDLLRTEVPKFHNEYALSKYVNEKQIEIAQNRFGLEATILRFFNAYGPGEYYTAYRSVVCLFIYRLMKGLPITVYKDYHRVFMYVGDWARTVANVADRVKGLEGIPNEDRIFNIGGTEYLAVDKLVEMIVEKLGGTNSNITVLTKEQANIQNKRPNIRRAEDLLDHHCRVGLDEGLDYTIQWMKQTYPND